jgi:hypothetical protein
VSEGRARWIALLRGEIERREAEAIAAAGSDPRQAFVDKLREMAQSLAATAHLCPLQLADMSVAERVACHLLPEPMRPAGLGTEDEIWAEYQARSTG